MSKSVCEWKQTRGAPQKRAFAQLTLKVGQIKSWCKVQLWVNIGREKETVGGHGKEAGVSAHTCTRRV